MNQDSLISVYFRGKLGQFSLDARFEVPALGVTAIFGPSGSGKTSVLRAIAGLHRFTEGHCSIAGEVWQDKSKFRPVHQRALGYVFQEASLFPHLSVRKNLTYGVPKNVRREELKFNDVIGLLGLEKLLERSPANLSGGERQRVAIGRALLSLPKVLLMDEPLSALDRFTKDEILPYLEILHHTLQIPVIYVSHDMAEIERLADQLVLMDKGQVIACGAIGLLQSDPKLPLIISNDAAVSLDATVEFFDAENRMAKLKVEGASFMVPSHGMAPGDKQRLRILAGDVSLTRDRPTQSTIVNILPARILSAQETGDHQVTAILGLGDAGQGAKLLSRVTRMSWRALSLTPGIDVFAQVKGVALVRQHRSNV